MDLNWQHVNANGIDGMDCWYSDDLQFHIAHYINGEGYHWMIRRFDENGNCHTEGSYDIPGLANGYECLSDAYRALIEYVRYEIGDDNADVLQQPTVVKRFLTKAAQFGIAVMLSASSIFGAIGNPVYAYADDAQDAGIVIEYKNGFVEIISASESGTSYLTESLANGGSLRQISGNDALAQYAFDAIQSGEGTVTQSVLMPSDSYGYVIANSSDSIMIVSEDAASALAGFQMGEGDALPVTVQKINVAGNDALQDALYQSEDWGVKSTIPEVYALIIVAAVAGVLLIGATVAGAGFVMLTYFSERL